MPKRQHYCGFCGKSGEEVEGMLAGPCIEVCYECVDTMHQIVHAQKPILPVKPAKPERKIIPFAEAKRR